MKELSGKVVQVLDEISGESSRGPWRKKSFVLELPGEYPKKVCIDMWGDRIDEFDVKQGEDLKAAIDIESREYNGKWFTNVKAWKIDRGSASPQQADSTDFPVDSEEDPYAQMDPQDDDLPF